MNAYFEILKHFKYVFELILEIFKCSEFRNSFKPSVGKLFGMYS